jgi:hypothetical protein
VNNTVSAAVERALDDRQREPIRKRQATTPDPRKIRANDPSRTAVCH